MNGGFGADVTVTGSRPNVIKEQKTVRIHPPSTSLNPTNSTLRRALIIPPKGDMAGESPGVRRGDLNRYFSEDTAEISGRNQDGIGGADGIRTHDPLNAIQVLFQLSYSPTLKSQEREL